MKRLQLIKTSWDTAHAPRGAFDPLWRCGAPCKWDRRKTTAPISPEPERVIKFEMRSNVSEIGGSSDDWPVIAEMINRRAGGNDERRVYPRKANVSETAALVVQGLINNATDPHIFHIEKRACIA